MKIPEIKMLRKMVFASNCKIKMHKKTGFFGCFFAKH